jgi:xanthine dehydrogenase accessory factor
MKLKILKEIIKKKENKSEFSIITNLETGNSEIFEVNKTISKDFEKYKDKINEFYKNKKSGLIKGTNIFVDTYIKPIKVIIVGGVNIAQYVVDYAKNLNFEIIIIDPRGYFTTQQRFAWDIQIINKWPNEAFKEINTDSSAALITLTHDPKIDDLALHHALRKKFYYIGALGSKKTHTNRCERLKLAGFKKNEINSIHGPIGIDLGGKAPPEIALSIIAQLILETYKT